MSVHSRMEINMYILYNSKPGKRGTKLTIAWTGEAYYPRDAMLARVFAIAMCRPVGLPGVRFFGDLSGQKYDAKPDN